MICLPIISRIFIYRIFILLLATVIFIDSAHAKHKNIKYTKQSNNQVINNKIKKKYTVNNETTQKQKTHNHNCLTKTLDGKTISCTKSVPSVIVVDLKTNKVLYQSNANTKIYPASLTKVMTSYIVFSLLKNKTILSNESIIVSRYASKMPPSKLGLKEGEDIKMRDAIDAMIIRSANDATMAIAEHIGRSEKHFVALMNKNAKKLGMQNSNFVNPTGWFDSKHYTTNLDLAKLIVAIRRDFPQYIHLFAKKSFKFKNRTLNTTHCLLRKRDDITGFKTGFNNPAGFNLITAIKRDKKELLVIVTGCATNQERSLKTESLIKKYMQ